MTSRPLFAIEDVAVGDGKLFGTHGADATTSRAPAGSGASDPRPPP
jgi:hypothetical protein